MTNWYTAESYWTKSSCLKNSLGSLLCQKLHGRNFKKPYDNTVSLADILRSNEKWWLAVSFFTLKVTSPAVSWSILKSSHFKPCSCLWSREEEWFLHMVGNSHGQEQLQLSQHRHAIRPGALRTSPRETSILSMPWICITRALALELVPCIILARRSHGHVPSASWQWQPFTVSWPCKYLCPQMIRLLQCSLPAVCQTFEYFCQICLDVY